MTYGDWYDLIDYFREGKDWTDKEVACLTYTYKLEYDISKQLGRATAHIHDIMMALFEGNSPEEEAWFKQIAAEITSC